MDGEIEVAAIVASLQARSFNRWLYEAALTLKPAEMRIRELAIADLPFYSEDIERAGDPPSVQALKAAIAAADALLFVTPEYIYSIPGVLKNALDWASRPSGRSVFVGKPAAIMGASSGRSGTMRAQLHLRQIFTTLDVRALNKPEIYVTFAGEKFDESGTLIDEPTRELVRQQLALLAKWTRLMKAMG